MTVGGEAAIARSLQDIVHRLDDLKDISASLKQLIEMRRELDESIIALTGTVSNWLEKETDRLLKETMKEG